MTIKSVIRSGNPILQQVALPVTEFSTGALDQLITDMFDTLSSYDGAGLAAPQIGVSLRVVVFGFSANKRYPDAAPIPLTVLINPEIVVLSDDLEQGWEGCLSIPDMKGLVLRYKHIIYRGVDPSGQVIEREVTGFHARVVQHECDHLDGILYPQRMTDMRYFGFCEELELAHSGDDD